MYMHVVLVTDGVKLLLLENQCVAHLIVEGFLSA